MLCLPLIITKGLTKVSKCLVSTIVRIQSDLVLLVIKWEEGEINSAAEDYSYNDIKKLDIILDVPNICLDNLSFSTPIELIVPDDQKIILEDM
ncbi:hypothetical protein IEQ34_003194 [Dendrobium chrysotoxum]|uniref:Uncharacterized protein n=1 Tax=Dendrobium chrysotoxum TaxID=161865 RepID=A0AAV7HGL4_DENCH|nr:hypothetical protein IEQ34_003194 [Dendrobium chrysotoxum]